MRIETDVRRNTIVAVCVTLMGILIYYLGIGRDDWAVAGGFLLMFMGLGVLLYGDHTVIMIYPERKSLTVRKSSILSRKKSTIHFTDVDRIEVVRIGKLRSGIYSYFLNIYLKDGSRILTGRNSSDRDEIMQIATKAAEIIDCKVN